MENFWLFLKRKISSDKNSLEKKNQNKIKKNKKNLFEPKKFFSLTELRHNLKIEIIRSSQDEIIIQIHGIDFSIINSLRRILLGEVASFSIQKVFFYENSSILNDEIITHRLSLIPLFVPPEFIDFSSKNDSNKFQKVVFELRVIHPQWIKKKVSVFSNSLKWKSYGIFGSLLKNCSIKPVFRDILILKLNPGQIVNCECHCTLGKGIKHSKFSPVGTTFYRIFPKIKITNEIVGKNAEKLFIQCPVKVFDIEEVPRIPLKKLIVSTPNFCTFCKECLKISPKKDRVIRIGRVKSKVTLVIESTGVLSPEILFHRAVFLLVGKSNEALYSLYENFSFENPKL